MNSKSKFVDITGNTYNRLTVIEYTHKRNGKNYWLCRCICGNSVIVESSAIKGGQTKSCGCLRNETVAEHVQERAIKAKLGKRYGKAVIARYAHSTDKYTYWEMLCDCGNSEVVSNYDLRYYRSCKECKQPTNIKIDRTGEMYGNLTVVEFHGYDKKRTMWLCRCICGNTIIVAGNRLISGVTRHCGCNKRKPDPNRRKRMSFEDKALSAIYSQYKYSAKERNLCFVLTTDDILALVTAPCHYCGELPSAIYTNDAYPNQVFLHGGIDRKNSADGYALESCVPCCANCNRMKADTPYDKFIDIILRCAEHIKYTINR